MNNKADKSASADKYFTISLYLVLAIGTFIAYHQILHNDFINFDDDKYVIGNPHVQSGLNLDNFLWAFGFTKIVYWMPLAWLSHILDCQLFGLRPGMHHLTSLLIHIASALLLFAAFKRMTGAVWRSAFVAALFALHPINVDSVAWIAERKNVLSTFFWMLTMLAYVYYTEKPSFSRYLLIIAAFVFGLLSKPMLVTLPCVLLLLDYWPLKRFVRGQILRTIFEKLPLFALTAASTCLSSISFKDPYTQPAPMNLRIANALVSYIKYIFKLIWPADLAVLYPYPSSVPAWQVIGSLLLLVCVSAIVIWLMRKKPYLVTGWLWFTGTLVPVLGLVQIGLWPAMADRWLYVPSVGIFIIIAWGVYDFCAARQQQKIVLGLSASAALLALSVCTRIQVGCWRDNLSLFSHAQAVTKDNYLMHYNYGVALNKKRLFQQAAIQFTETLRIKPDYGKAHNNLGTALVEQGCLDEAIVHFNKAVQLNPENDNAHYNLGLAYAKKAATEKAVAHLRKSLQLKPDDPYTLINLAAVLIMNKKSNLYDSSEALKLAERACELTDYKNLEMLGILTKVKNASASKAD